MTTFKLPAIMCDHTNGCDQYAEDLYALDVSSVEYRDERGTFRPTSTERALGWVRRGDEDFCPEHNDDAKASEVEEFARRRTEREG